MRVTVQDVEEYTKQKYERFEFPINGVYYEVARVDADVTPAHLVELNRLLAQMREMDEETAEASILPRLLPILFKDDLPDDAAEHVAYGLVEPIVELFMTTEGLRTNQVSLKQFLSVKYPRNSEDSTDAVPTSF